MHTKSEENRIRVNTGQWLTRFCTCWTWPAVRWRRWHRPTHQCTK